VGVALMAMREQPDGFPRYRDKADVLSALVNKALDVRGLRPEVGQSLYSLRHTFEDRLTAVDAPDKIIACLMGHKWSRPRYGVGPSLDHKREWLERIAFRPPSTV
jgi:integrase